MLCVVLVGVDGVNRVERGRFDTLTTRLRGLYVSVLHGRGGHSHSFVIAIEGQILRGNYGNWKRLSISRGEKQTKISSALV